MWLVLALLSSVSTSFYHVFKKKLVVGLEPVNTALFIRVFSLLIFSPALFFLEFGTFEISAALLVLLVSASVLGAIATVLVVIAFKHTEVSKITPTYTFLPALLLVTSYLVLGELPSIRGIAGVLLIVAGAYLINVHHHGLHPIEPFVNITKDKGSRALVIAMLIYSLTSNLDKVALEYVPPLVWMVGVSVVGTLVLTPLAMTKPAFERKKVMRKSKLLFLVAMASGLGLLTQFVAIQHTYVSYVFAIKRTDVIFTIILSWFFFKEHDFIRRLEGAVLMVLGAVIVGLS